jgi:transposase
MDINHKNYYLTPFQLQLLNDNLQKTELPDIYRQRLKIMLFTDYGHSQAEICRMLGCSTATASRWIQITKAGLAHQYLESPVGRPKVVTDEYIEVLRELLEHSPKDYDYPFSNWTVKWLSKHLVKQTGTMVSESHLKRVMRELNLSTRRSKALSGSRSQSTNIFLTDLCVTEDDSELTEISFLHLNYDAKIYGAASFFPPCFCITI